MTRLNEHEHALILRKQGESISSIAKSLMVSKGTVSYWCKDIVLTDKQIQLISERSKHHATLGLLRASEIQRSKRQHDIELATHEGQKDVAQLSRRDIFMVGLGLYWGEGYKKGNQELGFTNSDPAIIVFYIEWLTRIYGIKKKDLILRVSINIQHTKRVADVERYWSIITKIPNTQFTKISLIKSRTQKTCPNPEIHYGTLRVKVRRGTELRRKILGSISALNLK